MSQTHDIVPEGFDLDSKRKEWSSTDNDDREHCPECHCMSIVKHVDSMETHGTDSRYQCAKCRTYFDEPISHAEADQWQGGRND